MASRERFPRSPILRDLHTATSTDNRTGERYRHVVPPSAEVSDSRLIDEPSRSSAVSDADGMAKRKRASDASTTPNICFVKRRLCSEPVKEKSDDKSPLHVIGLTAPTEQSSASSLGDIRTSTLVSVSDLPVSTPDISALPTSTPSVPELQTATAIVSSPPGGVITAGSTEFFSQSGNAHAKSPLEISVDAGNKYTSGLTKCSDTKDPHQKPNTATISSPSHKALKVSTTASETDDAQSLWSYHSAPLTPNWADYQYDHTFGEQVCKRYEEKKDVEDYVHRLRIRQYGKEAAEEFRAGYTPESLKQAWRERMKKKKQEVEEWERTLEGSDWTESPDGEQNEPGEDTPV